jgi:hypothetical protein
MAGSGTTVIEPAPGLDELTRARAVEPLIVKTNHATAPIKTTRARGPIKGRGNLAGAEPNDAFAMLVNIRKRTAATMLISKLDRIESLPITYAFRSLILFALLSGLRKTLPAL